jgi:hypothetical protein
MALSFTGGCVVCPGIPDTPGFTSMALAAWIRPRDITSLQGILTKGITQYISQFSTSLQWKVSSGAAVTYGAMIIGKWQHLVFLFDNAGPTRSIFYNGASVASASGVISLSGSADPFTIGALSSVGEGSGIPGSGLNGDLAEVGMWNSSLTANEIGQLGRGVKPNFVRRASLLGYWPLIGSSPEPDFTGRGNNGTPVLIGGFNQLPVKTSGPPLALFKCRKG